VLGAERAGGSSSHLHVSSLALEGILLAVRNSLGAERALGAAGGRVSFHKRQALARCQRRWCRMLCRSAVGSMRCRVWKVVGSCYHIRLNPALELRPTSPQQRTSA